MTKELGNTCWWEPVTLTAPGELEVICTVTGGYLMVGCGDSLPGEGQEEGEVKMRCTWGDSDTYF